MLVGEQRWGQREDVGEREKEDDKRKIWRGSGEEGEKKNSGTGGGRKEHLLFQ